MKDMLARFKEFCKEAAECERIARVASSTSSLKRKTGAATGIRCVHPADGSLRWPARRRDKRRAYSIIVYE
jgi:hypothetical protein